MHFLDQYATLTAVIDHHASVRADDQAIVFVTDADKPEQDAALSYAQLREQALALAGWLQQRQEAGSRILLLYPSGLDFPIAFLACLYAGMIAVPAPLPGKSVHEGKRLAAVLEDAGIADIWTTRAHAPEITAWLALHGPQAARNTPVVATDVCLHDGAPIPRHVPVPLDADTIALLQYTSGSTGQPKGVILTHGNLLHNITSHSVNLGVTRSHRLGGWIPLFHDMGLMGMLLPALLHGTVCALMTPATFVTRPLQWLCMMDRLRLTYSAAPNFAYQLCARAITDAQLATLDLSAWQIAVNGSEPIQASTLKAFAERFAAAGFDPRAIAPCYGLAESTVFVSGEPGVGPRQINVDPTALGRHQLRFSGEAGARVLVSSGIVTRQDVRIVNPHTCEAAGPDEIGEIWVRGGSVSQGYWRNPRVTQDTFHAEIRSEPGCQYLRSGDYGVLHDGRLYVTGRLKEILIVNGRNLYPHDIEHELRQTHAPLSTRIGAVFAVSDPQGVESAIIVHEVQGQHDNRQLQDLSASMRQTALRHFSLNLKGVVLLPPGAVLRTTSGKIQRNFMREAFLGRKLTPLLEDLDDDLHWVQAAATTSSRPSREGASA